MKQYKIQCRMSKKTPWKDWKEKNDRDFFKTEFESVIRCQMDNLRQKFPTMEWRMMWCYIPEWFEFK